VESQPSKKPSKQVTEARSLAQRAKLDAQDEARRLASDKTSKAQRGIGHQQQRMLAKRRARATIGQAIADYLLDHEGGNSSDKTL